jgi:hypothetical protein
MEEVNGRYWHQFRKLHDPLQLIILETDNAQVVQYTGDEALTTVTITGKVTSNNTQTKTFTLSTTSWAQGKNHTFTVVTKIPDGNRWNKTYPPDNNTLVSMSKNNYQLTSHTIQHHRFQYALYSTTSLITKCS